MTTHDFAYRILPNGNMLVTASNSGRQCLSFWRAQAQPPVYQEQFIAEYLELEVMASQLIGALTDGLILSENAHWDDAGDFQCPGPVYWDRGYMVDSMTDNLRTRGRHILIRVHEEE